MTSATLFGAWAKLAAPENQKSIAKRVATYRIWSAAFVVATEAFDGVSYTANLG